MLLLALLTAYAVIANKMGEISNNHIECENMCSQFNLTGIVYPDAPCQCFRPECITPSTMGTLYYKCNESELDLEAFFQTGVGLNITE